MPQRTVVLVGGAGYIGTVLADELLTAGYGVRCLDLLLYGQSRALDALKSRDRFEFVRGDLCDRQVRNEALEDATDVIVMAGLVGDEITKRYPIEAHRINSEGVGEFLAALNGRRLGRVVYLSSCVHYAPAKSGQELNENSELRPLSLFAAAQAANEQWLLAQKGGTDYEAVVLRFGWAFGLSPRMRFDLDVNRLIREAFLGRAISIRDAAEMRPYCHVRDFARAIRMALAAESEKVSYEAFNAGGERNNCTTLEVVEEIKRYFPALEADFRGDDPARRLNRVGFGKIRDRLGFTPQFSVRQGVAEVLQALKYGLFKDVEEHPEFYENRQLMRSLA